MKKDIKPYKQKGMTCAIVCMLMILEYYKKIPKVNWYYEKKYYRIYKSKYMDGTPFSAILWHFIKNGFEAKIIHSSINIFDNKNNYISNDVFENSMIEYKEFLNYANKNGAIIKNGIDFNCDNLKQELENDYLIILAGQYNNSLHAILLIGYENESFIVCDPMFSYEQNKSYEEITNFMKTQIGKWYIAVKPLKNI